MTGVQTCALPILSPKIEYWIEYALTEQSVNVDDLVEQLSSMAWDSGSSDADIARFLKEFHDAPHRSEQARSFVDELCLHLLRWFAVASADDLDRDWHTGLVSRSGGCGFTRAASFVGHLIECGLLGRELVGKHLSKPLTSHYYNNNDDGVVKQVIRADAIFELFTIAGNTLLQGFLAPEDVQVCFERLEARTSLGGITKPDAWAARLNVRYNPRLHVPHQNLTYGVGTSRDPRYVVAAERRGRAKE